MNMKKAAITEAKIPDARRPQASEIHEQKKRPMIADRLTHTTSLEASGGVMPSTITNSVTCHSDSPTPPVWVNPVRQPAKILRGYLKISSHLVCSTGGSCSGREIFAGSIISAQASDLRAS